MASHGDHAGRESTATMRPDRRDFLEPGDLALTSNNNRHSGITYVVLAPDRWTYFAKEDRIDIKPNAPGIVVGSVPHDLLFDVDDFLRSDESLLRDYYEFRYVIFPTTMAWMHHTDVEMEKKLDET